MDNERSQSVPYVITIALDKDQISVLSSASKIGTLSFYASSASYQDLNESILNEDSVILEYLSNGLE